MSKTNTNNFNKISTSNNQISKANNANKEILCPSVSKKVFMKTLSIEEFTAESALRIKDFICGLCKGIYNNPVFDECGHTFCKQCIETSLEIIDFCPSSHKKYTKKIFEKAKLFENLINKQKVFCSNKSQGCAWIGILSERKAHVESECERRIIFCKSCKENSTDFSGYPYIVKEHEENFCDFANVECEKKCGFIFKRIEKNLHLNNCPKELINCPLGCKEKILREKIEEHLNTECPFKIISCGFKQLGCEMEFTRQEEAKHLDDFKNKHSKSLVFYLRNFEENLFLNAEKKGENFFTKMKNLEFSVKEKEKKIDEKIEIALKQLEDKRIKELKLKEEIEQLEKELINARGLEDPEIKEEEPEEQMELDKSVEAKTAENNQNFLENKIENEIKNFENFAKEEDKNQSKINQINKDFYYEFTSNQNNSNVNYNIYNNDSNNNSQINENYNESFSKNKFEMLQKEKFEEAYKAEHSTLKPILKGVLVNNEFSSENYNQESILKEINTAYVYDNISHNNNSYNFENLECKLNNNESQIYADNNQTEKLEKNSPKNSLNNSNFAENSKQSETPMTKRKRGRPSMKAMREAELLNKANFESSAINDNLNNKEDNSLNSSFILKNYKNKENENLNFSNSNVNNTINEDSKSNLNSSDFSFNPIKGKKTENAEAISKAENLNLSLNSDNNNNNNASIYSANPAKSFLYLNKFSTSKNTNNYNNNNDNKTIYNNKINSNNNSKKDLREGINAKIDYKKEILERNIHEMHKRDMLESRKINAGDLFSKNLLNISNAQKHSGIAKKQTPSLLKDFSSKSKPLSVDLNSPSINHNNNHNGNTTNFSHHNKYNNEKKMEIILSDEENEKSAQALKKSNNLTTSKLDQIHLNEEKKVKENSEYFDNSKLSFSEADKNTVLINNNKNNNNCTSINNKNDNCSFERIKSKLKKRENEKKIIDDFLQNYSTNFSNNHTLEDSENSNSNSNLNSSKKDAILNNENSDSNQKVELNSKQKISDEIEKKDKKLNYSGEESDFQMLSPQVNKELKTAKLADNKRSRDSFNSPMHPVVDIKEKILENNFNYESSKKENLNLDEKCSVTKGYQMEINHERENINHNKQNFEYENNNLMQSIINNTNNNNSSIYYNIENADFCINNAESRNNKNTQINSEIEQIQKTQINNNFDSEFNNSNLQMELEVNYPSLHIIDSNVCKENKNADNNFKTNKANYCTFNTQADTIVNATKQESMEVEINPDLHLKNLQANKAFNSKIKEQDNLEIVLQSVKINVKNSYANNSQSSSAAKYSDLNSADKNSKYSKSKLDSAKKSERIENNHNLNKTHIISLSGSEAESSISPKRDIDSALLDNNCNGSSKNIFLPAKEAKEEVSIEIDSVDKNSKESNNFRENNSNKAEKTEKINTNNVNDLNKAAEQEENKNYKENNSSETVKIENKSNELNNNKETFKFNQNNKNDENNFSESDKASNSNWSKGEYKNFTKIQSIENLIFQNDQENENQENYFLSSNSPQTQTVSEHEKHTQFTSSKANNNSLPNNNLSNNDYNVTSKSEYEIINTSSKNKLDNNFSLNKSNENNNYNTQKEIMSLFSSSSPNTKGFNLSDTESKISNSSSKNSSSYPYSSLANLRTNSPFALLNNEQNILDESSQENATPFIFDKINISHNLIFHSENRISLSNNANNANEFDASNLNSCEYSVAIIDYPLKNSKKTYKWRVKLLKLTGWVALGICYKETIIANNYKFVYGKNLINNHGAFIFSLNGYRWNTSVKNEDNQKNSNFPKINIEENNEVILEYIPAMKLLIFNYGNYQAKLKYVHVEAGKTIIPCVVMVNDGTELEIEKI